MIMGTRYHWGGVGGNAAAIWRAVHKQGQFATCKLGEHALRDILNAGQRTKHMPSMKRFVERSALCEKQDHAELILELGRLP